MRTQQSIESGSSETGSLASTDPDALGKGLDDEQQFMTAEELARVLRVTTAWVYTQTRNDQIPHVALGRYVRYRRSAIARWLRENERKGR